MDSTALCPWSRPFVLQQWICWSKLSSSTTFDNFYEIIEYVTEASLESLEMLDKKRKDFEEGRGPQVVGVVDEAVAEFRREIEQLQRCCPRKARC